MTYFPEESRIICQSKEYQQDNVFAALDKPASKTSPVPDRGE
jgi:hypothetical protein